MKTHAGTGPYGLHRITWSKFIGSSSIQSQSTSGYLRKIYCSKQFSLNHRLHSANLRFYGTVRVFLRKFRKISFFSYFNNSANFYPIELSLVSIDQRLSREHLIQQIFLSRTLASWSKLVVLWDRTGFSRTKIEEFHLFRCFFD